MRAPGLIAFVAAAVLVGCAPGNDDGASEPGESSDDVALGPVDGRDLPGVDLDRVQAGDLAPDFSLRSLAGPVVTLSDFRGEKNVILVFYRGYW